MITLIEMIQYLQRAAGICESSAAFLPKAGGDTLLEAENLIEQVCSSLVEELEIRNRQNKEA